MFAFAKNFLVPGLILFLIFYPRVAVASSFYLGLHGGATLLDDAELTGSTNPVSVDFDLGYSAALSLGYELTEGRLELETAYQTTDIEGIEIVGMSFDPGGSVSAASAMFNSYADYDLAGPWAAHFMVGLGASRVALDQDLSLGLDFSKDDDIVFAYQSGLGLSYDVARSFVLDASYRYFGTRDPEFNTSGGEEIEMEYRSHNLNVGFRYSF